MSFKERLLKVQKEGAGLSQRVEQKRRVELYKKQITQYGSESEGAPLLRTERLLVVAGVLDMLAEAIDYTKGDVDCFVTPALDDSIRESGRCESLSITLQWGDLRSSWKELGVTVNIYSGCLSIYAMSDVMPAVLMRAGLQSVGDIPRCLFSEDLTRDWWQDREKLESAMAEALWAADIRVLPEEEAGPR